MFKCCKVKKSIDETLDDSREHSNPKNANSAIQHKPRESVSLDRVIEEQSIRSKCECRCLRNIWNGIKEYWIVKVRTRYRSWAGEDEYDREEKLPEENEQYDIEKGIEISPDRFIQKIKRDVLTVNNDLTNDCENHIQSTMDNRRPTRNGLNINIQHDIDGRMTLNIGNSQDVINRDSRNRDGNFSNLMYINNTAPKKDKENNRMLALTKNILGIKSVSEKKPEGVDLKQQYIESKASSKSQCNPPINSTVSIFSQNR